MPTMYIPANISGAMYSLVPAQMSTGKGMGVRETKVWTPGGGLGGLG